MNRQGSGLIVEVDGANSLSVRPVSRGPWLAVAVILLFVLVGCGGGDSAENNSAGNNVGNNIAGNNNSGSNTTANNNSGEGNNSSQQLAICPDTTCVIYGVRDTLADPETGGVWLVDIEVPEERQKIESDIDGPIYDVEVSPNGQYVAFVIEESESGDARVYFANLVDSMTAQQVSQESITRGTTLHFSPDSRFLFARATVGSNGQRLKALNTANAGTLSTVNNPYVEGVPGVYRLSFDASADVVRYNANDDSGASQEDTNVWTWYEVSLADSSPGEPQPLLSELELSYEYDEIAHSQDATYVAFSEVNPAGAAGDDTASAIWLYELPEGVSSERQVLDFTNRDDAAVVASLDFSPDKSSLAVLLFTPDSAGSNTGTHTLEVVGLSSNETTFEASIPVTDRFDAELRWTPDSQNIVVQSSTTLHRITSSGEVSNLLESQGSWRILGGQLYLNGMADGLGDHLYGFGFPNVGEPVNYTEGSAFSRDGTLQSATTGPWLSRDGETLIFGMDSGRESDIGRRFREVYSIPVDQPSNDPTELSHSMEGTTTQIADIEVLGQ